jgi:hypothetical protein
MPDLAPATPDTTAAAPVVATPETEAPATTPTKALSLDEIRLARKKAPATTEATQAAPR